MRAPHSVVTTGAANSVTNSATLTVNTPTTTSQLTQFPNGVCPGNSPTFSTVASGTGPFTYMWSKSGSVCWRSQTGSSST